MEDEVLQKLKEIMTGYDASILGDPRRCEALLRDFLSSNKKEMNLLIISLKAGIVNDLKTSVINESPWMFLPRLAKKLETDFGIGPSGAIYAVETWASALGIIDAAEITVTYAETPNTPEQVRQELRVPAEDIQKSVGLKSDGTVVAVGLDNNGQCKVGSWEWEDIIQVAAGGWHTVGLKSDGTVVTVGSNYGGRRNVDSWKDITQVAAGSSHTVGLKSNGTVVAVGENDTGQCNVDSWKDIIQVATGKGHTVGLKSNGTVVAVGLDNNGQCKVGSWEWEDIIQVAAGEWHTVGLKSDGTVVPVG